MTNQEVAKLMSPSAMLEVIGERLLQRRVERNLTQAELAKRAGVGKRTLERLEAGESTQLSTFIKILTELGLAEDFLGAIPEAVPGPMELLKAKGAKPRRRVRHPKKQKEEFLPGRMYDAPGGWTWGDEGNGRGLGGGAGNGDSSGDGRGAGAGAGNEDGTGVGIVKEGAK